MSRGMTLTGASLLVSGIFFRTMTEKTKDISERLLDGQKEILEAIRGPLKKDNNGNPIDPDYARDNLSAKMDELSKAVDRLADGCP